MPRRYPTAASREQSIGLLVLAGMGAAFIAFILYLYVDTRGAPPEVLLLTAPGLAMMGGAWHFWNKGRSWVLVDFTSRRATCERAGKSAWTAPLDELAPLAIVTAQRELTRKGVKYRRTEYRVVTGGARDFPVYADWTYRQVRRKADALAREWKVGLCPLDGRIRQASELDRPLGFVQAGTFAGPSAAAALPPESGITLEEGSDSAVVRRAHRLRGAEAPNYLWLIAAGMTGLAASERNVMAVALDPTADRLETALVSALVIAAAAAVGRFAYEAWRAVLPAEITIGEDRVRYRGRSVPTAEVVEVTNADVLYIFTPRAALEIPPGFCVAAHTPQLVQELRRLIAARARRQ